MRLFLLLHIAAGLLGLASGAVALSSAKGGRLHRAGGMLFVCTMLPMCVSGILLSAIHGAAPAMNMPAALVTAYLVTTALTTVRPVSPMRRRIDTTAMVVAFVVGAACFAIGIALLTGGGRRSGMAYPLFMFGTVSLLAGIGDLRLLRREPPRGAPRLARHLWRMCFALFVAALSFFIGQADEFPAPIRILPLLALPPLVVLVSMLYWLWRVRRRPRTPAVITSSPIRDGSASGGRSPHGHPGRTHSAF